MGRRKQKKKKEKTELARFFFNGKSRFAGIVVPNFDPALKSYQLILNHLVPNAGIHSLIINGVVPSDGGYYKAIVRNSAGEIESEAELYVEPTGGRPLGGTELYNT